MKIAYTMNGIFGGFAGKNSKSNNINESELILKYTYSKLKKYILDNNNIDLFIFSWHHELKDEFNTIMSPTRLEVCEQIDFKPFDHFFLLLFFYTLVTLILQHLRVLCLVDV